MYVVGLLGWAPPHVRKTRVKSWKSKNSAHDGIKHCIGKKCDKIFFFLRVDLITIASYISFPIAQIEIAKYVTFLSISHQIRFCTTFWKVPRQINAYVSNK
ncbi:hypothetical protein T12_4651, partial [Trichinella patagoniensis]